MELANFKVDITGERNATPPQYFKKVDIVLNLTGKNLNAKKVARAGRYPYRTKNTALSTIH